MEEETKVNLINMLGEEKANLIFKQTEESAKRNVLAQEREENELKTMIQKMVPRGYLLGGEYYVGHRWRGKHVAMWDSKEGCFLTINYTMGEFFIEKLPYFGDVEKTNRDGFIPFNIIEKVK